MNFQSIVQYFGLLALFISLLFGGLLYGISPLILIFGGIIIITSLYYLVNTLIKKKVTMKPEFKAIFILFSLYIIIGLSCAVFSLHYLTIKLSAEADLMKNGIDKIEIINDIRKAFPESVNAAKNDVKTNLTTSLKEFNNAPAELKSEIKKDLLNVYNLSETTLNNITSSTIDDIVANWINSYISYSLEMNVIKNNNKAVRDINSDLKNYYSENKDVFNNLLAPIKVFKVYYFLDDYLLKNKNLLETQFNVVFNKYDIYIDALDNVVIPKSTVELNSFMGLWNQYKSIKCIFIYIFIHLLILFPFLYSRKKGLKPTITGDPTDTL